jgi:hypothetical protein
VDRYRLAAVRDARSRDERVKRGDYADAVSESERAAARIDAAERCVAELRAAIASNLGILPATAGGLVRRERFVARLRRDLEAAHVAVDRARAAHAGTVAEVDLARGTLVRARADKQVIERHFEGWRAQQAKLADRRED